LLDPLTVNLLQEMPLMAVWLGGITQGYGGVAATAIVLVEVARFVGVLPDESFTEDVNVKEPATVGVPVIVPVVEFRVSPLGRFPELMKN
jgi:hypothetical protein